MISVIHASDDFNETLENDNKSVNLNNSFDDLKDVKTNHEDYQSKPEITIMQSDNISIIVNSPIFGVLNVSIDGKYNSTEYFYGNEIINVSTYDECYFSYFDSDFINLKPGIHNISFILSFPTDDDYTANFSIFNSSCLTVDVVQSYSQTPNISKYETFFNVIKKDKTVHILNIEHTIVNYDSEVRFECNNLGRDFLIIISKNNHVIRSWFESIWFLIDSGFKFYTCDIDSIGEFNLTIVNLKDGTNDSALFNVYNELKIINLTYLIKNNNITVYLKVKVDYNTSIETYLLNGEKLGCSISYFKDILVNTNNHLFNFEFEFDNLLPDNYEFILQYDGGTHVFPFEIGNYSDNNYSNYNQSIIELFSNMTLNNTGILMNNPFDDGRSNYSNIGDNNSSNEIKKYNHYHRRYEKNKNIDLKRNIGDLISSSSQEDSIKSYELSIKSVSKSVKNIYPTIGLIILFILSFLIGYFKFRKNIFS